MEKSLLVQGSNLKLCVVRAPSPTPDADAGDVSVTVPVNAGHSVTGASVTVDLADDADGEVAVPDRQAPEPAPPVVPSPEAPAAQAPRRPEPQLARTPVTVTRSVLKPVFYRVFAR